MLLLGFSCIVPSFFFLYFQCFSKISCHIKHFYFWSDPYLFDEENNFEFQSCFLTKYVAKISRIFSILNGSSVTLPALCISESYIKIKLNLNFYFHTSLWYLKRFYEGLKDLDKTFWRTTKKCENKNLS